MTSKSKKITKLDDLGGKGALITRAEAQNAKGSL